MSIGTLPYTHLHPLKLLNKQGREIKMKRLILYYRVLFILYVLEKEREEVFKSYRIMSMVCSLIIDILNSLPIVKTEIMNSIYQLSIIRSSKYSFSISTFTGMPIDEKTTFDLNVVFTRDLCFYIIPDIYQEKTWFRYEDLLNQPTIFGDITRLLYEKFNMIVLLAKAHLLDINIKGMVSGDEIVFGCDQV